MPSGLFSREAACTQTSCLAQSVTTMSDNLFSNCSRYSRSVVRIYWVSYFLLINPRFAHCILSVRKFVTRRTSVISRNSEVNPNSTRSFLLTMAAVRVPRKRTTSWSTSSEAMVSHEATVASTYSQYVKFCGTLFLLNNCPHNPKVVETIHRFLNKRRERTIAQSFVCRSFTGLYSKI